MTKLTPEKASGKFWYREAYGWLVFAPLILVILACVVTVTIAFKNADDTVSDDYYREGLLLGNDFQPTQAAQALAMNAELHFNWTRNRLTVNLNRPLAAGDSLHVLLSHPAEAGRDRLIPLRKITAMDFVADLDGALSERWYLRLSAYHQTEERWRLQGEINFSESAELLLE